MRPVLALLAAAALAMPVAAETLIFGAADRGEEVRGTAAGGATVYPAQGFDSVALATGAMLDVRVGPDFSVRATGPAAAFADFRVDRSGRTLRFLRRNPRGRGNEALERQMRITVTMPRIAAAALGGSGRVAVDRVAGERFDAAVGGSGGLALGELAVRRAEVLIGGSGSVTAAGRADLLTVNVGGSGGLDAPGLRATSAEIATAGSGGVRARVDGRASVALVGSGSVDLGPGARCTVTRMGSGRVRCG